jgi:hypothetical protein
MSNSKHGSGGGIYKRGSVYWIRYSAHGERHRESSKSEKRHDAERLLRKRLAAVDAGKPVGASVEKTTLSELAEILLNDYRANGRRSVVRAQIAFKALFQPESGVENTLGACPRYSRKRLRRRLGGYSQPYLKGSFHCKRLVPTKINGHTG